jgi:hypothetical protein
MSRVDGRPCQSEGAPRKVDHIDHQPFMESPQMIPVLAVAFVLGSLIALAFAALDTVRFVRRTGDQVPAALTYRAYLV